MFERLHRAIIRFEMRKAMRTVAAFSVVLALFNSVGMCTEETADIEDRGYNARLPMHVINQAAPGILGATNTNYQPKTAGRVQKPAPRQHRLHHRHPTGGYRAPPAYGPRYHAPAHAQVHAPSYHAPAHAQVHAPSYHAPAHAQVHAAPNYHKPTHAAPPAHHISPSSGYHPSPRKTKYGTPLHRHTPFSSYHSPLPAYRHFEDEPTIEMFVPQEVTPFPFMGDEPEAYELMPMLGLESHCFLQQAPFSQCGRQSLQSLMMEQCLSFYLQMTRNIEGLCRSKADPSVAQGSDFRVRRDPQPTETGDSSTVESDSGLFLQERCYHRAYVSITSAMVMCLTENIVRTTYIEHYASQAATNPIEGPVLYLRKLHEFIESVLSCAGDSAKSKYPTLWRKFKLPGRGLYNPNSPFRVDQYEQTHLQQGMSYEAAGLTSVILGSKFLCSETQNINTKGLYESSSSDPHYSLDTLDSCTAESKEMLGYSMHSSGRNVSNAIYQCNAIIDHESKPLYLSDMSLRGLYESVRYSERETAAARRPLSIAEIATKNSGVYSQPALEGFGIMYFCAFYACKANTENNIDGSCFPEVDPSSEWSLPEHECSLSEIHELSVRVETCKEDGWLDASVIDHDIPTQRYQSALERSYICLAESEIARFAKLMYPNLSEEEDAHSLVYMRHIAIEKCYETEEELCVPNRDLYLLLKESIKSLLETCALNRRQFMADVSRPRESYHYYQQQHNGPAASEFREAYNHYK